MKILIFASLLVATSMVSGCANRWDQQDDRKCKSWGMTGSNYLNCRQMLSNQRSAAISQISSGLNQMGQSTSSSNSPAIIPPCMASSGCYRNDY